MSIVIPLYIGIISYILPDYIQTIIDQQEKNKTNVTPILVTKDIRNVFGALCLELYLVFGFLTSAVFFLMIRSWKSESFMQQEWMHAQLRYINNLGMVDYLEWNYMQVLQFGMHSGPLFTCIVFSITSKGTLVGEQLFTPFEKQSGIHQNEIN